MRPDPQVTAAKRARASATVHSVTPGSAATASSHGGRFTPVTAMAVVETRAGRGLAGEAGRVVRRDGRPG